MFSSTTGAGATNTTCLCLDFLKSDFLETSSAFLTKIENTNKKYTNAISNKIKCGNYINHLSLLKDELNLNIIVDKTSIEIASDEGKTLFMVTDIIIDYRHKKFIISSLKPYLLSNINIISYIADMLQASKTRNSVDSPTVTGLRTGRGQRLLLSVENRLYNVEARPRYPPGITDEKNKLF